MTLISTEHAFRLSSHLAAIALLTGLFCAIPAQGNDMRIFNMGERIQQSDAVVYCEEEDVQFKEIQHDTWKETITIVKCRVLSTIKGDLAAGAEFTADYGSVFQRRDIMSDFTSETGQSGKTTAQKAKYLPPGKALMFLRKDEKGAYHALDARLVQDGKVFRFVQMENPGDLYADPQEHPEYIKLAPGQPYGEKELLEDAAAALKMVTAPWIPAPGR